MKPVVFLFSFLLLLSGMFAQQHYQQSSEEFIGWRGAEDWEAMRVAERRLYVEGYAAGQMALLVDLAPAGEELVQKMYELTILETPVDTILSHLDEIYEVPGFRDVPVAVAVQLAHHYTWQIRQGLRRPVPIDQEKEMRRGY